MNSTQGKFCFSSLIFILLVASLACNKINEPTPPDQNAYLDKWVGEYAGQGVYFVFQPNNNDTVHEAVNVQVARSSEDSSLTLKVNFQSIGHVEIQSVKMAPSGVDKDIPDNYLTDIIFRNDSLIFSHDIVQSMTYGERWTGLVLKN